MRVVFIQYGIGNSGLAKMMVHSVKRLGYEVWQLSDETAPKVTGVDKLTRHPMKEGRMIFRTRLLSELEAPYVLLDTDMLVMEDLSEAAKDCDVALTWREKHIIYTFKDPTPIKMPYNGGVVFVNNSQFMKDCLFSMEKMTPKLQDWYGDQIALRDVAKSGKYKVKELKDTRWNFVPEYPKHDIGKVKIFHFKGLRKEWMPGEFLGRFGDPGG